MSAALDIAQPTQPFESQVVTEPPKLLPLTAERKLLCAEVLVKTGGNVAKAAELLGTTRQNIHRWTQTDPAFREIFEEAIEGSTDNLEQRYYERAMSHSDRAAEFLLRARRPEKYREVAQSVEQVEPAQIASAVFTLLREAVEQHRATMALDQQRQLASGSGMDQPAIDITATVTTTDDDDR